MTRRSGFTLIELMIIVTIIAVIAAIAIPNLLAARLTANETSAISTLRNITSCQAQFQASGKCDVDGDGTGEFGLFREMAGATGVRTNANASAVGGILNPPVLSGAFRVFNPVYEVSRSGYLYRICLPQAGGTGLFEFYAGSALAGNVDSDLAETTWCCYAVPVSYSNTGNRTFFVNQGGDISAAEFSGYSGTNKFTTTNAGAAFAQGGAPWSITGKAAVGTVGRDSRRWKPIN